MWPGIDDVRAGHAELHPERRQDEHTEHDETDGERAPGRRSAAPVHRRPAALGDDVGILRAPAISTLSPSATRTAGNRVSAASATATTDMIMPSAIDRNTITGTRNTAANDSTTVSAERNTALPAVDIVFSIAATASLPSTRSSR